MILLLIQHTCRPAGVLVFILLLGGCASAWQSEKLRANPPRELPPRQELTQTPFYPQQQYQCGPAALATILNYHAVAVTPQDLVAQVYLPARKGSLQIEMIAAIRHHGMLPYPLKRDLADLLSEVAAGHPVLVLQNLSFGGLPVWHYAVVIGYDLAKAEIVLRSGTTRSWVTSLAAFERSWARANYWALVILPPGQIPATAEPLRYLNTALELEQTNQPGTAYSAYQAAVRRWPNWPRIWLALGNAAYQRKQFPESVDAFLNASRIDPVNVTGWNNLAYALLQMGCPLQASRAIDCALELAPQDTNIHDSIEEIASGARGRDRSECPRIRCPVP
jgi:tetratricopeptide (TPR) repeat protein